MSDEAPLNPRERQILHAVVHAYITSAEPVGSRTVVKRFGLDVSPATVRNVMADLEESGYLEQVHTSSGRVPTGLGYQYYVDHLMQVQSLTSDERGRIEAEYRRKLEDADLILQETTHLLSLVTHQAGIAEAPDEASAAVMRIELMPLGRGRVAVLMADNLGRVRTIPVTLDRELPADEQASLTSFLNDHLRGTSVNSLATAVEQKLRTFFDEQRQLAELALSVLHLLPEQRQGRLFLDGVTQLMEQPEFKENGRAREVFGIFEEQERLVHLLRHAVEKGPVHGTVVIGVEQPEEGQHGMSVIATPYAVNGEPMGMVGILGPRRMPYHHLTSVVEYTAGVVGRMITRLVG